MRVAAPTPTTATTSPTSWVIAQRLVEHEPREHGRHGRAQEEQARRGTRAAAEDEQGEQHEPDDRVEDRQEEHRGDRLTGVGHRPHALRRPAEDEQGRGGHRELHGRRPQQVGLRADPPLAERAEAQREHAEHADEDRPRSAGVAEVGAQDDQHARDADDEAADLQERHPLAEQRGREQRREHRAQRVEERGEGRAEAEVEGDVHQAELDRVHHEADQRDPAEGGAVHPGRPAQRERQSGREHRRDREAPAQHRERGRGVHGRRARDVARGPDEHEGRCRDQGKRRSGPRGHRCTLASGSTAAVAGSVSHDPRGRMARSRRRTAESSP